MSGSRRQEAQKPADVSLDGPLIRYGLDDWKLSLPIGMALSVPLLANEVSPSGVLVVALE